MSRGEIKSETDSQSSDSQSEGANEKKKYSINQTIEKNIRLLQSELGFDDGASKNLEVKSIGRDLL